MIGLSATTDDDQIESIFVPYTTLQKVLGIQNIHTITLFATHAGETTRISKEIRTVLRKRHHLDSEAVLARMRQTGLGGDQMPRAGGGGFMAPDDFTVKTQAAEALTKGLYTSVAAFILANMPKVDQVNMQEMAGTLEPRGLHDDSAACGNRDHFPGSRRDRDHEHHARLGDGANARNRYPAGGRGASRDVLLSF